MDDQVENTVTLVCCRCGKKSEPMTGPGVQLSIDLVPYAEFCGFSWVNDMFYRRALIFCSKECDQAAKTKRGFYRKYPNRG